MLTDGHSNYGFKSSGVQFHRDPLTIPSTTRLQYDTTTPG
jgi:hypothetical protein